MRRKDLRVQGKKNVTFWVSCTWRVYMWACLVWLREIPLRTQPGFIPSDHVHPLFIALTHSPRCRDMIPMSHHHPPPSALTIPSHILHRPFTPASHEAFLLLWIVESHVQRSRGSHTYRGGLYVWMCTRKAGAMGISYKTLWGPESERRRQVPAADIWWHSLHYFTSVWDQDIEYSISNAATCFWCDVSVTKATNTS